jgi:O-methyltransferase
MKVTTDIRGARDGIARRLYSIAILPFIHDPLIRQRVKLSWFVWGYWPLILRESRLSGRERIALLTAFLRVDWLILHGHTPREMADISVALAQGRVAPGQAIVEAGCWNGGSTAKFSHLARRFECSLHVYDSFQGVEDVSNVPGEWEYSGQYASPETTVRRNLERCGSNAPFTTYPGWFSETLAAKPVSAPIALAYIDCDIAKGTYEALSGLVHSLAPNGVIFSQDFHISPVRSLLTNPETWSRLGVAEPKITQMGRRLAKLSWEESRK